MKNKGFKSEEEFAEIIVKWLKKNGYEVYQEVQAKAYSGIADIVAEKNGKYHIIECKLSLGFKVMAQADGWKNCANYVSVAVPYTSKTLFREKICKLLNIGVIAVSHSNFTVHELNKIEDKCIRILIKASEQDLKSKDLINQLTEKHKTYAKAGNNYGKRITPFSNTVDALTKIVKENSGILLKQAITKIKHHYVSNNSAYTCIRNYISNDVIKGFEIKYEGKKPRIYLKEIK